MGAGPELSVAASKTFVATLAVLLRLTAAWTDDAHLGGAIERLPDRLTAAAELDWSGLVDTLVGTKQPGHDRSRADACHRARSLAQAQGDLQPACRSIQRRGVSAWAGGAGLVALSGFDVHADRCRGAGMRQLAASLRDKGTALFTTEPGASGAGRLPDAAARPSGDRRRLPDPELLCHAHPPRGAARHRRRSASPPAEGHAHADERIGPTRGRSRAPSSTARDLHHDCAVVIEGAPDRGPAAAVRFACGVPTRRSAGRRLARARLHRRSGERRRRRAVQRRADPGGHRGHRCARIGASGRLRCCPP